MPQDYETLYIIKADLPDEDIDKEIESITKIAESEEGASTIELSKWGKKRLAYSIKKQRYGFYVLLRFTAGSSIPEKLTRHFRLNENILKGIVVIYDHAAGREIEVEEKKPVAPAPVPAEESKSADTSNSEA